MCYVYGTNQLIAVQGEKHDFQKEGFSVSDPGFLYFVSTVGCSTLNTVLLVRLLQNLIKIQNQHLDPLSLLMDGSGILKPGSGPV